MVDIVVRHEVLASWIPTQGTLDFDVWTRPSYHWQRSLCYNMISFGLKILKQLPKLCQYHVHIKISKTIEVYVDDILVKSMGTKDHIQHL